MAEIITEERAAAASGVAAPKAKSTPPPASAVPATRALRRPGCSPIESNMSAVPPGPPPPNQPKSFCVPWPMKSSPMITRARKRNGPIRGSLLVGGDSETRLTRPGSKRIMAGSEGRFASGRFPRGVDRVAALRTRHGRGLRDLLAPPACSALEGLELGLRRRNRPRPGLPQLLRRAGRDRGAADRRRPAGEPLARRARDRLGGAVCHRSL